MISSIHFLNLHFYNFFLPILFYNHLAEKLFKKESPLLHTIPLTFVSCVFFKMSIFTFHYINFETF